MRSIDQPNSGSTASRIVGALSAEAESVRVSDARIGLGYTAVMLSDGRAGVGYTFRHEARGCCDVFRGIRPLSGRPAIDLLRLLESDDPIEAGVGLACANALLNQREGIELAGDILAHLDVRSDDCVAMVGHFEPLVDELRRRARRLTIFERVEEPFGLLRPQEEAFSVLPECPIALITSTSVINHTIDALLEAARNCREVVLLGASTPMLPEVFVGTSVTMLSGVLVQEPLEVLRVVSEGGGMRQFRPHVRKVTIKVGAHEAGL